MGLNSQIMIDNIRRNKQRLDAQAIVDKEEEIKTTDLTELKWIGEKAADTLYSLWYKNIKQLKEMDEETLTANEKNLNPISYMALKKWLNF